MSAAGGRAPRLLPPLARGREWLAAGLGAGLCLGTVESLALHAQGIDLAPSRMLAGVALDAGLLLVASLPLAVGTALSRRRLRHSTLAGGAVGLVLLAPLLPRLAAVAEGAAPRGAAELLVGLAVAAAGGAVAAAVGSRLERAGIPISGPPLWLAVSVLMVGASASGAEAGPQSGWAFALGLAALVLVLALLAAFLAVFGAHRQSLVPWPWSRTLVALGLLASATALAPRLLPWLVMDPTDAPTSARGADLIAIDLGAFGPGEGPALRESLAAGATPVAPNLTILAAAGLLFRRVLGPEGEPRLFDWLRLPDGLPLARALRAQGFVTRVAGVDDPTALPPGLEATDARGLGSAREAALRESVGFSLLLQLDQRTSAGDDAGTGAARVTTDARRKIASALALEPDRPLLLFVDFGAAARDAAQLDDAVGALLEFLADLGLEESVRVLVSWRDVPRAGAPVLRVLLRPAPSAREAARGLVIETPVLADEVAERAAGLSPRGGDPG